MQIDIMSFTGRGIRLSEKIWNEILVEQEDYEVHLYTKYGKYQNLADAERKIWQKQEQNAARWKNQVYVKETIYDWMRMRFEQNRKGNKTAVIWIGACGIAVRAMAPSLRDKLTDIPVLVVDEAGQFVIPVLSGHYGGANELARLLADRIGAVPVITTATDVNHAFAVDVFAKENGLLIQNKAQIAAVSSKVLDGKKIVMLTDGKIEGNIPDSVILPAMKICEEENLIVPEKNMPPENMLCEKEQFQERVWDNSSVPDVIISVKYPVKKLPQNQVMAEQLEVKAHTEPLWLVPRTVILGMGCKRGKSCGEIEQFVLETLEQEQIPVCAVAALATIDLKKEEPGFLQFAEKYGLDLLTYPKEVLKEIPGFFSSSEFVAQTVGVDNVCERAALAACQKEEPYAKVCCDSSENQKKVLSRGRLLLRKKAKDGMTLAIVEREWSVRFDET